MLATLPRHKMQNYLSELLPNNVCNNKITVVQIWQISILEVMKCQFRFGVKKAKGKEVTKGRLRYPA